MNGMNNAAFFPKLAWNNISKNKKIYLPYMLTTSGIIMMFYIVFHLNQDPEVTAFQSGTTLQFILGLGVIVVGIFSVIFLFYTNSFLMKRRKTELGLYNVLGLGKIHIARVVFWETVYMAVFSLVPGMGLGVLLSKIGQLGLFRLLNLEASYTFSVNFHVLGFTAAFFAVVFVLLFLFSLHQIGRSSARELLSSEKAGEKEPRANGMLAAVGVILLGAGYVISQIISDPMSAIGMFFIAVILVILGTYCCFIAGSVALCKLLRKNKTYYYKTNHFISVSSMIYRMKRNGAGLASICILSTMVLVMLSSTACMYLGGADAVEKNYPRDMMVKMTLYGGDMPEFQISADAVDAWLEETLQQQSVKAENLVSYRFGTYMVHQEGNTIESVPYGNFGESNMVMNVVTLEDYNASENQTAALKPGQVLVYDDTGRFAGETLNIFGREYQVAEILEEMAMQKSNFVGYSTLSVVTADMAEFSRIYEEQEKLQAASMKEQGVDPKAGDANSCSYSLVYTLGFDEDGMSEAQKDAVQGALDQLDDEGYAAVIEPALRQSGRDPFFSTLTLSADSSEDVRDAFYSLYGGMFFLGILLSITFLLGTVLIMYYKQITEGYDDQGRFEILRKVGMSDTEIRKTINSQVLTVFFAPLLAAGMHVLFAFHMIALMLSVFAITNTMLLALISLGVFLVFGVFYAAVYMATSRAYYRIVS